MANLFELQAKYDDIYKFIRYGQWFSKSEHWMDYGESSKKACEITKDVNIALPIGFYVIHYGDQSKKIVVK